MEFAATLLSLGRTFHSHFKVPLFCDKDKNVTFSGRPTDNLATDIVKSAVIIWNEAPIGHRHLLEGLDRLLQDLMKDQRPFGKTIILAGAFSNTSSHHSWNSEPHHKCFIQAVKTVSKFSP